MKKKERRNFNSELNIENREDESKSIIGHAAVFNSLSENLGGFRESIQVGAFDDVLDNDVRALFNHDSNQVLGRTKSGTLRLSVDEKGLRYEITPPNTSVANDLIELLQRGDVDQSSFGFIVDEDKWEERDGEMYRTITKVKRLFDISPVTYPAYPDTDAAKRSMEEFKEEKQSEEQRSDLLRDRQKLMLKLLNLRK